ncbi:N/A [soil metagenome]
MMFHPGAGMFGGALRRHLRGTGGAMSNVGADFEGNAVDASPRPRTAEERDLRQRANAAMDRYARGDDSAFDGLYDLLVPRLLPYAKRRTGDASRAEDLVQQAVLQMHLARASFRNGSDVLAWAFAITTRLAIDGYRRRKSEVLADDPHAIGNVEPCASHAPEQILAAKEMAVIAERTLQAMPEGQRVAYELVREQGFCPAEAADILGTTPNAVNLRVHRAYDAIRAAFAAASKDTR